MYQKFSKLTVRELTLGNSAREFNLEKLIGIQCYRKVPKFSDARKLRCNLPKIQTKRPNLRVFRQKMEME